MRTRSSGMTASQQVCLLANGTPSQLVAGWFPSSLNPHFSSSYSEHSSITDVQPTPRSRRDFNPVSHTRRQPAAMTGDGLTAKYVQYGKPALSVRPVTTFIEVLPTSLEAEHFQPQWGAMIAELASKLNGHITSNTLLLVSIAELGKTIRMVRNPFGLLKKDWRKMAGEKPAALLQKEGCPIWVREAWQRTRNQRLKDRIGTLPNAWLEFKYGWSSLYQDVKSVATTSGKLAGMARELHQGESRFSVKARETENWTTHLYPTGENATTWSSMDAALRRADTLIGSRIARCINRSAVGDFRVGCRRLNAMFDRMSTLEHLLDAYGTSGRQVVSTLWELVPFSFVIDWFIDWHAISSYSSYRRLCAMDVTHVGCSKKLEYQYTVEMLNSPVWFGYYQTPTWYYKRPDSITGNPVLQGTGKYSIFTRSTGLPSADDIVAGFIDADLTVVRGISGLSLIIQKILGQKAKFR